MKLLSLFFLAISFSANAQILNKIDSLGNRQGVWEEYYKTGKIKSKAFYIDNLRYGEHINYSKKGYVKEILYFNKGNLLLYKTYYRCKKHRGQVKRISGLKYDKTISKYMYSVDSSELSYGDWNKRDSSGLKIGKWYESNVISVLFNWMDIEHYYYTGFYLNGKKEGLWYFYNYDGKQLKYICNYKNGLFDGEIAIYNTKGCLKAKYIYKNGKRNGDYIAYFDNGNISVKATFQDGDFVGEYFKYNKKGVLKKYIKDTQKQHPYK